MTFSLISRMVITWEPTRRLAFPAGISPSSSSRSPFSVLASSSGRFQSMERFRLRRETLPSTR